MEVWFLLDKPIEVGFKWFWSFTREPREVQRRLKSVTCGFNFSKIQGTFVAGSCAIDFTLLGHQKCFGTK